MKVVGLMSGTSSDGVDAALVDIRGGHSRLRIKCLAFDIFPYPRSLQEKLIDLASGAPLPVATLCHLNAYIGERFADAVTSLADQANHPLSEIKLIGSHGQTVQHLPALRRSGKWSIRSTLQLGEPSIIAERTGITTVADFRPRDMAAGGEGAPLTPYLHYHLFKSNRISRAILNLGGISNISYLPAGANIDHTLAFDVGPGNMLIDGLVTALTKSRRRFDRFGAMAKQGRIDPSLFKELMKHPFLKKVPPKSTGREIFGYRMAQKIIKKSKKLELSSNDVIATATAFTVGAITQGIERFILKKGGLNEVIVGGGGVQNHFLMTSLMNALAPTSVHSFEKLGYDPRAIEAMTFALLAYQTWHRRPGNIPNVTGARHPVVLGKIVPGNRSAALRLLP